MTLTEKHIAYANNCRSMFVGQTIRAVMYGEVKIFADAEGLDIKAEPHYNTRYSDVDTVDLSVCFKTDDTNVCVFWDNTFICYGLRSKPLDVSATTNDYEQKWDVSAEQKWASVIGHKIVDFNIIWSETWTSNPDGSNKVYTTYPQTFEMQTENGKTIILSASEFICGEADEIYPLMDNILVTTNRDLAKTLKMIA